MPALYIFTSRRSLFKKMASFDPPSLQVALNQSLFCPTDGDRQSTLNPDKEENEKFAQVNGLSRIEAFLRLQWLENVLRVMEESGRLAWPTPDETNASYLQRFGALVASAGLNFPDFTGTEPNFEEIEAALRNTNPERDIRVV